MSTEQGVAAAVDDTFAALGISVRVVDADEPPPLPLVMSCELSAGGRRLAGLHLVRIAMDPDAAARVADVGAWTNELRGTHAVGSAMHTADEVTVVGIVVGDDDDDVDVQDLAEAAVGPSIVDAVRNAAGPRA